MRILVTKDASTKIPRDVADLDEARNIAAQGFSVQLLNDDGTTEPLPAVETEQISPELREEAAKTAAKLRSDMESAALDDGSGTSAPAPAKKAATAKKAAPAPVPAKKSAKKR